MQLTTIAALRAFGDLRDDDDKVLSGVITAASSQIEKFCGRRFAADAETSHIFAPTLRGTPFGRGVLMFDDDLAEDASAIIDVDGVDARPYISYLDPYTWPAWGAMVNYGESYAWNPPVTVTGLWAYSKQPPADVEYACMRLSKWLLDMGQTTQSDAVVVTEVGAVLLPSKLPMDVIAILTPYRRPAVAG